MTPVTYAIAAAFALCMSLPAMAGAGDNPGHHEAHSQAPQAARAYKLRGRVNSVNVAAGRVNITHEPVGDPQLPTEMRINFKAHDAALLQDIKPGMVVDFEIQRMGDEYHLTRIKPVD